MKKLYALLASAAVGVMTASAYELIDAPSMVFNPENAITAKSINDYKPGVNNRIKALESRPYSRADEEADPSQFTTMLCYNYLTNWYEADGETQAQAFRGIMSTEEVEWTMDADGNLYAGTFFGYVLDQPLKFTLLEDGNYELELGQPIMSLSAGEVVLGMASNDGNITEGSIIFDTYLNMMMNQDGWIVGVNTSTGYFYIDLACADVYYVLPNATLSFTDDEGNEIVKRIYAEEYEADPDDPESTDGIMFSTVTPLAVGAMVSFDFYDPFYLAASQLALPSFYDSGLKDYTGDFYLVAFDPNYYYEEVPGGFDNNDNFTFPYDIPEYDMIFTSWGIMEPNAGYWFGECYDATVTFDEGSGNGVSSAVVDSEDAAPVYYNLQGIQVANPEAGKLYIVKKGNHTSKVIR